MIKIKTVDEGWDCHDRFKLVGVIETDYLANKSETVLRTHGERKSKAVEKMITLIDSLIRDLEESKKELGRI